MTLRSVSRHRWALFRYRAPHLFLLIFCLVWLSDADAGPAVEVEITGIDGELLNNVREQLDIAQLVEKPTLIPLPSVEEEPEDEVSDSGVRRVHRLANRQIRQALQPFGYYDPQIKSSLRKTEEGWFARYEIEPGPPTLVATIDIEVQGDGKEDEGIQRVVESTMLKTGQRLQHSHYENTKAGLLKAALKAGYLDAGYVKSELRVFPSQHRSEITLIVDTGPRYYFGDVQVEQDILDPDFVAKFVKIEPGEPFDTERLLTLQLALSDSGYFARVEVEIKREAAQDFHIPIVIRTSPAKKRRYGIGLGFGTDTGPRVKLATEQRRINRRGHSIISDILLSQIKQSIGTQYRVPIGNVTSDRLVYSASATSETVADDGDSDRFTLGVSRNESWRQFERRLYVRFEREDFSLGEDDDTVKYVIPGATLSQLKADNVLFPRRGYSWSVDLRGAAALLISETSFTRTEASGRIVYPLGERGRFLFRLQLGATGVEDFAELPSSERFFAGGDQSVRGYGYQKLGPTDDSGENIGGRYLAVGSAEADYLFWKKFGAAVFVDAGNADDEFPPDPQIGAGIGLRWRSPVGMLRVDLAHPFSDSDDDLRIHISIGPDL
jgi:translocation and assembly module TamA